MQQPIAPLATGVATTPSTAPAMSPAPSAAAAPTRPDRRRWWRRVAHEGIGWLALFAAERSLAGDDATVATDTLPGDPPLRTGLQGQTDALSAPLHALRDGDDRAARSTCERDDAIEDLVVVGAGLSGLAGAWLYRRHAGRPVRILLLDALDDIGGHARRNEFQSRSGERLVGYGGSQSLDTPSFFSPLVHSLLADIGVSLERFPTGIYDRGWAARHGLVRRAVYFPRAAWGDDRLVVHDDDEPPASWLGRTPLPADARQALLRLWTQPAPPLWPTLAPAQRRARLAATTYADYLRRHWRLPAAAMRWHARSTHGYFGVGIDAVSALDARAAGLPGFDGLPLGDAALTDRRLSPSARLLQRGPDDYVYHFPDGNAGVARALLRQLMPRALPGDDMASLASARLAYERLDDAASPVRLRLGSPVLGLRHLGPPERAQRVELRYRTPDGTLRCVQARQVLLACWHRVIPQLTDELPEAQVRALLDQVKVPLLYANALLSNWRAWQRAGTASLRIVDGFWDEAGLDMPVALGRVRPPDRSDRPILVHLAKVVVDPARRGRSPREQAAAGRRRLLGWSESRLVDEVASLLQGALGGHGFDATRDLEAVTVNRWAHGYALEYARPWDAYWPDGPLPCVRARRGWGRVAIANSDAGAYAYAHSAIDQAARAVQELLPQARMAAFEDRPGPPPRWLAPLA